MGQLSVDLGACAKGHVLVHKDKEYEFRHLTFLDLSEFEKENYRIHKEKLREFKEDYGQEEYVKRLDELRRKYDSNQFSLQHSPDFIKKVEAIRLLLSIMVKNATIDEVIVLLRERREEVIDLLQLVIDESIGVAGESNGDKQDPPE